MRAHRGCRSGRGCAKSGLRTSRVLGLAGFGDLAAMQAEQVAVHGLGKAGAQGVELQPEMLQPALPINQSINTV